MKRLLITAVALFALTGCDAYTRAMIEAEDGDAGAEAAPSYTVTADCDQLTVEISGYPADGVAFFFTDGAPPYHLHPAGDAITFPLHIGRWGILIRDGADNVLIDNEGVPTECVK